MAPGTVPLVFGAVKVRAMTTRDLEFAADLHRRYLGYGLFPALGPRFLRSYLKTFLSGPFSVALIAEVEGAAAGFLVGVIDERAHYRTVVRRHGPGLALRGMVALTLRPAVAWRFARTRARRYITGLARLARADNRPPDVASPMTREAVLTHLAVAPEARGAGVGSALVGEFTDLAKAAGLPAARLITRDGCAGAGRFYERLGWQPTGGFEDRDGLTWTRYRLDVN